MSQGGSSPQESSILVVDDNPLITNVISGLLGSENYNVVCCKNGEEALTELESGNDFDLIICDVMMPKLDGYGFHSRVRERSDYHHVPFIFLTALDADGERQRGKETGVDDYVVKPFNPKELLATIKGKIDRSRQYLQASEEQSEKYRKKVIHTLSHEFRTPLVAINTGTELLLEQKDALDPKKAESLLTAIQRGGMRLEKLVNDFMLMQQIEAGVAERLFRERSKAVDVAEVVSEVVEKRREEFEANGFEIQYSCHVKDARAKLYVPHIQDLLLRFLDNAKKFSKEDKVIEVVVSLADHEIYIEVRDRGIGIDLKRVRHAMDAFGQVDRDMLEQQGGGLGLALAEKYAAIHGGRLDISNREEGGAIISLVLPVIEPHD